MRPETAKSFALMLPLASTRVRSPGALRFTPESSQTAHGSVCPLSADTVAKVRNRPMTVFPPKDIRPTTADLCSLKRVTEVAREFIVGR